MKEVVGIRFKPVGKTYYFAPEELDLNLFDKVIVETVRGIELGEVVEEKKEIKNENVISTLKPVLRKANDEDMANYKENLYDEASSLEKTEELVKKNELEMKLLGCEYTLDRSKLIIYFTAEGRVDFRQLVKDLAAHFRLRIELRQVGSRDGAKFLGGIGPCGYILCCNTFLGEFKPVSIRMAKNQNLSLNPSNISGLCGKLLCCIRYEDDTYTEYREELPKLGSFVQTEEGRLKVIGVNIIDRSIRVMTEDEGIKSIDVEDLKKIEEFSESKTKK
ncbi:MAG: stage 0 sporulation family protein [Candidatus Izimaplasma sp.]|nr:stage 0 sporulation family protein [Candidatus Izimaplasma bacterium]